MYFPHYFVISHPYSQSYWLQNVICFGRSVGGSISVVRGERTHGYMRNVSCLDYFSPTHALHSRPFYFCSFFFGGGVPPLKQKCLSEINGNSDIKENWRHQRRSVKPDVVSMEQPLRQETESFGVAPTVHPSPSVATLLLLDAVFWMTADGTSHRIGTLKSTVLTWTDEINECSS